MARKPTKKNPSKNDGNSETRSILADYLDREPAHREHATQPDREIKETIEEKHKRERKLFDWQIRLGFNHFDHLTDEEFSQALDLLISRLGFGPEALVPISIHWLPYQLLGALLIDQPEFKRPPGRPKVVGGTDYQRYVALRAFQTESADRKDWKDIDIIRELIRLQHRLFAGYTEETMAKSISRGRRIWKEAEAASIAERMAKGDDRA